MWNAGSVEEGMERLGRLEVSFNWVFADSHGAIGYQMSGLVPRRRGGASGLVPLPGWDPSNDWLGFHEPADLPRLLDPERGFIVTANDDLNRHGRVEAITVAMGSYRADRIAALLEPHTSLTVEDMRRIQQDLYSLQAERFMAVLEPLLPETTQAETLRRWDRRYDVASAGATLFEHVYRALRRAVFGAAVVDHLIDETALFADFYAAFDRVLLAERSAWFGGEVRDELYRRVLSQALAGAEERAWGDLQQIVLSHMLFGGKLPRFLGFDRGPITLPGGRATPQQGQIYRSAGRTTSFVPSYRMVTDLARAELYTALVGGPSDRRWSRWYCSDLARWLRGEYKVLRP
jgi:penicillin amidase